MDLSINKLAQKSARVDKKERDQAFESIRSILSGGKSFSEVEFRKIWRGILYSFWLTDKLVVQVDYANRISELIHTDFNNIEQTLLLMRTFYHELCIQWKSIDKHRLSKYLSLIRSFSRESFRFIFSSQASSSTEEEEEEEGKDNIGNIRERIDKFNLMMRSTPLAVTNFSGSGLQIQLVCVFFPELQKIVRNFKFLSHEEEAEQRKREEKVVNYILQLLTPYFELFVNTINISVRKNIEERILDPLLGFDNSLTSFFSEEEKALKLSVHHWKRIEQFFHQKTVEGKARNMGKCFEYVKKIGEIVDSRSNRKRKKGSDILKSIQNELSQIERENYGMEDEEDEEENIKETETNENQKKKKKKKKRRRKRKKKRKKKRKREEQEEEEQNVEETQQQQEESVDHSPPMKKRKLD